MNSWDEDFRKLQVEFLRGGPQRLAEIDAAIGRLESGDRAALDDLKRHTHRLAGSGANYQRPAISEAARAAERRCDALLADRATPAASDSVPWREMPMPLDAACAEPLAPLRLAPGGDVAPDALVRHEPELRVLLVDHDSDVLQRIAGALEREAVA